MKREEFVDILTKEEQEQPKNLFLEILEKTIMTDEGSTHLSRIGAAVIDMANIKATPFITAATVASNTSSVIKSMVGLIGRPSVNRCIDSRNRLQKKIIKSYQKSGLYHPEHLSILSLIAESPKAFKILLCGLPGTGKTSIIKVIEQGLGCNVVSYNPSKEDDDSKLKLRKPASELVKGGETVLVIEDIDLLISKQRDGAAVERKQLQGLLQLLDRCDKVIITTNKPEALDAALTRAGRIDNIFNIGYLSDIEDAKTLIRSKIRQFLYFQCSTNPTVDGSFDWLVELVLKINKKTESKEYSPCELDKAFKKALKRLKSERLKSIGISRVIDKEKIDNDMEDDADKKFWKYSRILDKIDLITETISDVGLEIRGALLMNKEEEDEEGSSLKKFGKISVEKRLQEVVKNPFNSGGYDE